uniref:Uncharacterized protein n=1 Tax=Oryza nivara TaxID=4536 RepID=A0A0E0GIJ5_ORYNI
MPLKFYKIRTVPLSSHFPSISIFFLICTDKSSSNGGRGNNSARDWLHLSLGPGSGPTSPFASGSNLHLFLAVPAPPRRAGAVGHATPPPLCPAFRKRRIDTHAHAVHRPALATTVEPCSDPVAVAPPVHPPPRNLRHGGTEVDARLLRFVLPPSAITAAIGI